MSRQSFVAMALAFALSYVPAWSADATRGELRFKALCGTCHAVDPTVKKISVHLKGIIGRRAGSVPGIAYSTALKTSGWTWDRARLEAYLADPKKVLPGTTMMVAATDPKDRADIIAYLETLK